jgi:adenylate cyclase
MDLPEGARKPLAALPSAKRRLAAILSADVAGYSRLMGADEIGTHERLMAYRRVVDGLIVRHDGRVVGTAGDNVLAEFPSVVEALSAAVDVQQALLEHNAYLPPAERLEFRIGINLGDVIIEGDDIFGDGVNVAARLESLATPGGITVSGAVHDQVKDKLDCTFRDQGLQRVKNIAAPIRVYTVEADGLATVPGSTMRRRAGLVWLGAGGFALIAAAGLAIWLAWPRATDRTDLDQAVEAPAEPGHAAQSAPESKLDNRPAIAVLPFRNQGDDPAEGYFADGVTEDIITALGRFSNLVVMSWHAVLPYKEASAAPREVGRALDVRYLVDGSIRRAGDQVRVTVRLTDAERGTLLWSEQYDESLDDIFHVQDAITRNLVRTLAIRLTDIEGRRAFAKPTESLEAYDYVLRGRDLLRQDTRTSNFEARELLEKAVELDPGYAAAYVNLGWSYHNDALWGWTEWPHRALERAAALAEEAVDLDPLSSEAYGLLGDVLLLQREIEGAETAINRAIELNPNNAAAYANLGGLMVYAGRLEEAAQAYETALRFDPDPFGWWWSDLGQIYFLQGRYEDAIRAARRGTEEDAEYFVGQLVLAASYAEMDRPEEAAAAAARVRRVHPFFRVDEFGIHLGNPEHRASIAAALRKAGLE